MGTINLKKSAREHTPWNRREEIEKGRKDGRRESDRGGKKHMFKSSKI